MKMLLAEKPAAFHERTRQNQAMNSKFTKIIKKGEPILYLLPTFAVYAIFMVWPIIQNIYLSTLQWNMVSPVRKFVGINNYVNFIKGADFPVIIKNSFIYVITMMLLNFILPYLIAFVIALLIKKATHIYRSLIFFPSLLSLAVAAIVFMWLLNPIASPMAEFYKLFGKQSPNWFQTPGYSIIALSIITGWRCFGYNLILFLAAIIDVPNELIEAAKIEKASNWTIFWKIIRPLTASTAFFVFTITFIFGLQYVFTPIHILTQGGPNMASTNLVYVIYQYGFMFFQSGKSAAVAIISLAIFLIVVLIQKRAEKKIYYAN